VEGWYWNLVTAPEEDRSNRFRLDNVLCRAREIVVYAASRHQPRHFPRVCPMTGRSRSNYRDVRWPPGSTRSRWRHSTTDGTEVRRPEYERGGQGGTTATEHGVWCSRSLPVEPSTRPRTSPRPRESHRQEPRVLGVAQQRLEGVVMHDFPCHPGPAGTSPTSRRAARGKPVRGGDGVFRRMTARLREPAVHEIVTTAAHAIEARLIPAQDANSIGQTSADAGVALQGAERR
jgi:hypothetical protein